MGLEEPRDNARPAERVEHPQPVPSEAPLDLLDRAADLPKQRPLVPDIRNQLPRQVLRVLATGAALQRPRLAIGGSPFVQFAHRRSARA